MALTDTSAADSSGFPKPLPDTAPAALPAPALPDAALNRLPVLHDESVRAARLTRFLAHAIQAAWLLMLAGAATLAIGGGRSLAEDFAWSVLVLIGVLAMTRTYMRAFALKRGPVESLAADLRACLLYAGFAWGAGAFLALPLAADGLGLVLFASLPALLMAALLRDTGAVLLFAAPVAVLCASAAMLGLGGGAAGAGAVLLAQAAIVIVTMLLTDKAARTLPAGFALR
jgi:hypothetical protein